MAIWTGDLTNEQTTAIDYYMSKIKNCKKLQENTESSAEMERLDEEIHELETRIDAAYNAQYIYEDLLAKAHAAVDALDEWAKEYGLGKYKHI